MNLKAISEKTTSLILALFFLLIFSACPKETTVCLEGLNIQNQGNYPVKVLLDDIDNGTVQPQETVTLYLEAGFYQLKLTNMMDQLLKEDIISVEECSITPYGFDPQGEFFCGDILIDSRDGQPYPTVEIGGMCWMAKNLNIGTQINSPWNGGINLLDFTEECLGDLYEGVQTDNNLIEKYCGGNDANYCDLYGGYYQFNELMNYGNSIDNQDICPDGWHIPSDEEWKSLEIALGMSEAETNATGWRGTNQGDELKQGEFKALLGGFRYYEGQLGPNFGGYFWSSSVQDNGNNCTVWYRAVGESSSQIDRSGSPATFGIKTNGLSCGCVKD